MFYDLFFEKSLRYRYFRNIKYLRLEIDYEQNNIKRTDILSIEHKEHVIHLYLFTSKIHNDENVCDPLISV